MCPAPDQQPYLHPVAQAHSCQREHIHALHQLRSASLHQLEVSAVLSPRPASARPALSVSTPGCMRMARSASSIGAPPQPEPFGSLSYRRDCRCARVTALCRLSRPSIALDVRCQSKWRWLTTRGRHRRRDSLPLCRQATAWDDACCAWLCMARAGACLGALGRAPPRAQRTRPARRREPAAAAAFLLFAILLPCMHRAPRVQQLYSHLVGSLQSACAIYCPGWNVCSLSRVLPVLSSNGLIMFCG